MICINNISYDINNKNIIKNISFNIGSNGASTVMGENGAGKTTLLKLIAKIIKPKTGYIEYSNKNNNQRTSFLFQNHIFLNRTVQDNLLHCLSCNSAYSLNMSINIIKNALDKFNLLKHSSTHIDELSLGEKQCISLIRSLITKPEILFLDEPFNYLDENYKNFSKDILKKYSRDKKIILITHSIQDALFFSSNIIKIVDGRIV